MTLYFYDLETSGLRASTSRIMQFAGQRVSLDLKPIGEPDNILIKMTPDVLSDPDAVLVHGVTPQQTITDGLSEAEFLRYFHEHIAVPDTIFVGFNNISFDDEFIRFSNWRNFYDAYEWAWKDGRSRFDMLDVARMTRALRPDGIIWPFAPDGKPSNQLEMLASVNKLDQASAHDALSDVKAVIDLARLIKDRQPKLFDYLLSMRDKKKVAQLVGAGQPFIYTSVSYPSKYEKTSVVAVLAPDPTREAAIVYDLRVDPAKFLKLTASELAKLWQDYSKDAPYLPVRSLVYNKAPAVAPMSVLDDESAKRLKIDKGTIAKNLAKLKDAKDFADNLVAAVELMKTKSQPGMISDPQKVDEQLYDGFVSDSDKTKMSVVRAADISELSNLHLDFADERLKLLLPLYIARNYPTALSSEDREAWESFSRQRLLGGGDKSRASIFFKRLGELGKRKDLTEQQSYLLEELNLYGQSLVPVE